MDALLTQPLFHIYVVSVFANAIYFTTVADIRIKEFYKILLVRGYSEEHSKSRSVSMFYALFVICALVPFVNIVYAARMIIGLISSILNNK